MARQLVVIGGLAVVAVVGVLLLLGRRGGAVDGLHGGDVQRDLATRDHPTLRGLPEARGHDDASTVPADARADPARDRARAVRGIVLGHQGEPLPDARVYLLPKGMPGRSDAEARAARQPRVRTDTDGRFDLGRHETAGHWLGVLADGHLPLHLDGDEPLDAVEARMESGPLVHVTVVDQDEGAPDLDTRVLIEPTAPAWDWPSPEGRWAFRAEGSVAARTRDAWIPVPTREQVAVEARYRHVDPIVEPDVAKVLPPGDVTFRVLASCRLDLRVLDAEEDAPLAIGFSFALLQGGAVVTGGSTSLAGGTLHMDSRLPPGNYVVQVEALGYVAAEAEVEGLRRHGDHATVEVGLRRDPSLGRVRLSVPVLAALPKVVGSEAIEVAAPAFFLWKRPLAMAPGWVQRLAPGEASAWGGLAGSDRRLGDTDHLFEAVPPGEATLLVHAPGQPLVAVLDGVRIDAGSTNAVSAALEPGIVFRVDALDVEGRTIESLTVHHRVHGELPTYFARPGASVGLDPGEKPDPDWTLGPYPGPAIEVVTVDDRGTTRRHPIRLDDAR